MKMVPEEVRQYQGYCLMTRETFFSYATSTTA